MINGKTYIGQHKFSLDKKDYYMGKGILITKAIKKYGKENFKKDIIEVVLSQFETNVLEKYYIAKERAIGKAEYNIADGGEGCGGWNKGKHHSEKTKRKIGENNIGKHGMPKSEEAKKKMAEAHKGKPLSEEHKKKLKGRTPWNKGKKMSEEYKEKLSESHKRQPAWNKGKKGLFHHTEEEKRKQSEAQKGKHWFNNGKVNKFCFECPHGFVPGMLK